MDIFFEPLLIFGLRVVGIAIGTLSTLLTVQGRKLYAAATNFVSVLVYIIAIGKVVTDLSNVVNILSYCLGVAVGTVIGMMLDQRLALGFAEVRIISPEKSDSLAEALRLSGFGVTETYGHGRESVVGIVETIAPRKKVDQALEIARQVDEQAFITVRDARTVQRGYWRSRRRR